MDNNFLAVNKRLLSNSELTLLEKLIIAQIQEFMRNNKECYMTDRQFAEAFGVSTKQITRAMKSLDDKGVITRNTKLVHDNGQKSKTRTLEAMDISGYCSRSNGQNSTKAMDISGYCSRSNGQNSTKAMDKNEESNGQNRTEAMDASVHIKDNRKDNIKDNRIDKAMTVSESLIHKIKSIGIDVKQNTINAIIEAAGSDNINEEAISNIIDMCSEEGMFHGNSGYVFTVLKNQITDRYAEVNEFINRQKEEEAEKKRKQEEIYEQVKAAQPMIDKNKEQLTALCHILFPDRAPDDRMLTGALNYSKKIEDVDAFIDYHKKNPTLNIKCKGFNMTYNNINSMSDEYVNPIDFYITYAQDMMHHEQAVGA